MSDRAFIIAVALAALFGAVLMLSMIRSFLKARARLRAQMERAEDEAAALIHRLGNPAPAWQKAKLREREYRDQGAKSKAEHWRWVRNAIEERNGSYERPDYATRMLEQEDE